MKMYEWAILTVVGALGATWVVINRDNGLGTVRDGIILILALYSMYYYRKMKREQSDEKKSKEE